MIYHALVIDDNSVSAAVLSGLLKKCGIVTETEESGIAALEREDITSFDLIFTDYLMPELDGVETAVRIQEKAKEEGRSIPVILCSGNVEEIKEILQQQGIVAMILQKPVKQKELEYALDSCILWKPQFLENSFPNIVEGAESLKIPGLDTAYGIKMSGDIKIYKKILKEYYKAIDGKVTLICKYAQEFNIDAYKIEVHGLKSASRLIGALEFAQFCEKIERECVSYSKTKFSQMTEQLIYRYKAYSELLKPYGEGEIPKESRQEADKVQVKQWLSNLREALENFDFDEAEKIIKVMEQYRLPEPYKNVAEKLREKIDNIDYDGGIAVIDAVL